MIKQTLAVVGLAMTAMAVVVAPAAAVGNSDGSTNSLQGHGGTDVTSTHGHNSPSHHSLDNTNLCLPEVHHVQVGLIPVQVDVPALDQQQHQTCNVGHTTQGAGDAQLSHLIG